MSDDDLLALAEVRKHPERYRGETGAPDKRGLSGVTGPTGPQGDPGLVWRGEWNKRTAYVKDDAVESDGSSWVAKAPNTGSKPPSGSWDLLAKRGNDGAQGQTGHTGMAGIPISDEGIPKGVANGLNFVGSGVVASMNALGGADVSVSGGGGGGGSAATISDIDPGALGAGALWLQTDPTDDAENLQLWVRNAADDGWLVAGTADGYASDKGFYSSLFSQAADTSKEVVIQADSQGSAGFALIRIDGHTKFSVDSFGIHAGSTTAPVLTSGFDDPSSGSGVAAAIGSIYLRTDGTLFQKFDSADTDWTELGTGGGSSATDPGDIADPLTVTPEEVALAYNTLLANLRSAGLIA